MRHPSRTPMALVPVVVGTVAGLLPTTPAPALARGASRMPSDSSALVKEAHKRQTDFEMFHQSRIPVRREEGPAPTCDVLIGRMCIWFGGEDETDFPPDPQEVVVARGELLRFLSDAAGRVHDPWITGQLVRYLMEDKDYREAEGVARKCALTETWWCSALLGYVLHLEGRFVDAEAAFREATTSLPKYERERWITPKYIFSEDGEKAFKKEKPEEQARQWELFWRLSDPLYLVDGNDRLTDHFARWVDADFQRDAESPQGLFWEEDLEETLIRYGMTIGWSRTFSPRGTVRMTPGRFQMRDTRQVLAHHNPKSRGYLFPDEFLKSPSEIPPESWITAPRDARTWYAPPYAPDFRELETQVGRFRRGDDMLVVGAYQPGLPTMDTSRVVASGPAAETHDPIRAGLFLVPVDDDGKAPEVRGTDRAGVFTLRAPPGRYVSSLEVLDSAGKRAWRARQGVQQVPLVRGLVAVSDLMILEKGAALPTSLEEAIPHIRRGVRLKKGERFTVVWEVYGLRVNQTAQVTLGFTKGRPGFLARVGKFLGVLNPDRPVEVTFSDTGTDAVQSAFRAIDLELPDLDPGEYTLHLRLELPGREPAITSRPIVVEG